MLKSFCIAFSTYSRIPMPRVEWNEKNMRWAICYFPLVGAVIGALELGWLYLGRLLQISFILRGAVAAALPILISGGIHLDGFCDTVDALSSHQTRERMLEILKDSHTGAFAIIFCGLWLMGYFAGWCSVMTARGVALAALGFVLSRALSSLALTNWQCARKNGMLRSFADVAAKRGVTGTMTVYLVLCAGGMLWLSPLRGLIVLGVNGLIFLYYRLVAYKKFGGVTGDLAGWFTELAELGTILAAAFTEALV